MEEETVVCNLRGEFSSIPTSSIAKILPTLREGINVLHYVGGGWSFIVDERFIEFTEDEGEEEV